MNSPGTDELPLERSTGYRIRPWPVLRGGALGLFPQAAESGQEQHLNTERNNMSEDQQSEYSTPRNADQEPIGVRRNPNGSPRRPTQQERMQDIRKAGIRDEPLPIYTHPGVKLQK